MNLVSALVTYLLYRVHNFLVAGGFTPFVCLRHGVRSLFHQPRQQTL